MPQTGFYSSRNKNEATESGGLIGSLSRFWHVRQIPTLHLIVILVSINLSIAAVLCRRLHGLRTAFGGLYVCRYSMVKPRTWTACADWDIQILTIAEPFHRMFSLDNIAIQFPHAAVERVPVSTNAPSFLPAC